MTERSCTCSAYDFEHYRDSTCEFLAYEMAPPTSVPASREPKPFPSELTLEAALQALHEIMDRKTIEPPTFYTPRWASARWPTHPSDALKLLNELETR